MLWAILIVLLMLWAMGFLFHVAGAAIHALLVIAVIVLLLKVYLNWSGKTPEY